MQKIRTYFAERAGLTLFGNGASPIARSESKTNQTRKSVLLSLVIETATAFTQRVYIDSVSNGHLLKCILGNRLTLGRDPGSISRAFKSPAVEPKLNPKQVSWHPTRIGSDQELLDNRASVRGDHSES